MSEPTVLTAEPSPPHDLLVEQAFAGTISYMGGVSYLPELFSWSWSQMVQFNNELFPFAIHYDRARVSHHAEARNQLVNRFQGDWLLMLDTDHWFEPDLAWRLLDRMERYNLDVVTGLYRYKSPPYAPVLYCWGDPLKGQKKLLKMAAWPSDCDLLTVDAAGAGCLLVRRRVFDRIRDELGENPFDTTTELQGEDIAFFDRLRRLGIRSWVDTRVHSLHLTWHPIEESDWNPDVLGEPELREQYAMDLGNGDFEVAEVGVAN